MFSLFDESTGEVVGSLSRKEVDFLDYHLEDGFPEGEPSTISEFDIEELILAEAEEELLEKLRGILGDNSEVTLSWGAE